MCATMLHFDFYNMHLHESHHSIPALKPSAAPAPLMCDANGVNMTTSHCFTARDMTVVRMPLVTTIILSCRPKGINGHKLKTGNLVINLKLYFLYHRKVLHESSSILQTSYPIQGYEYNNMKVASYYTDH